MKKTRFIALIMILAVMLFGGVSNAFAATTIPESVVSDGIREVEYIKNFPVIIKTTDNGKYVVYCMNMSATYAGNITFSKTGEVDPGYVFILKNRPNTGDRDKDFYITQMAVWYYEDYLTNTDFNLVKEVKEYIVSNLENDEVARYIYNLYRGAKTYTQKEGKLALSRDVLQYTLKDGYYESSEIKVYQENLDGNIKYSLTNAPAGSLVIKSANGVKVKIPSDKIPEGKQLTFSLNVEGEYTKYTGYYYYYTSKYQKVLFQDPLETKVKVNDYISMTVKNGKEVYKVNISKTDVTQSKEVPGATLEVKDKAGNLIESWVSTDETHKIVLKSGEYSLTETLAPKGYKLSKTTIYFLIDDNGGLFVKNENGNYVNVNRVVMINELVDVVSFAKRDSKTNAYVSGAVLVIKDEKGNVVKEFTSTDTVYQLSLDAGKYTLSEKKAPVGYLLSDEVISFELLQDGTLKVKNNKGEYVDSVIVTYYNTPESKIDVPVPATDKNSTLLIIGGIALLIGGIACASKTIKEC